LLGLTAKNSQMKFLRKCYKMCLSFDVDVGLDKSDVQLRPPSKPVNAQVGTMGQHRRRYNELEVQERLTRQLIAPVRVSLPPSYLVFDLNDYATAEAALTIPITPTTAYDEPMFPLDEPMFPLASKTITIIKTSTQNLHTQIAGTRNGATKMTAMRRMYTPYRETGPFSS